jgi:cytochrome d ubiquinol oxidase subunit II
MIVALTFYALLGGADYGGGVWDIFAWGKHGRAQRELISSAIGPVWEANHVWLILVIVLLFTAFPVAFAVIATALHIPLTLLLIGIVLRGSAFTFRTYDAQHDKVQRRWSYLFSIASIITPILLGITLGAIASGQITAPNGDVTADFVHTWFAPFPFSVGFFALALFAFLAAVYLTLETDDVKLQDDFRRRAIVSGVIVGLLALTVFLLSEKGAPKVRAGLSASMWALPLHVATAICAVGAFWSLWRRKYKLARVCAAGQVVLILWGWALAQYPYIVEPDITISSAAAPRATIQLLLIALAVGALLLFPSFYYLFHVFKGQTAFDEVEGAPGALEQKKQGAEELNAKVKVKND